MNALQAARAVLQNKKYRAWLVAAILLITLILIARFFTAHPSYLQNLRHVSPFVIALVIALNIGLLGSLVWVYHATLQLCGKRLPFQELSLLTAYSSIINFFGPLQSGPGVRAVYLKTRWHVRLRDYTFATLIYYGLFACLSALFLLVGARPWWQTVLVLLLVGSFSAFVIHWFSSRQKSRPDHQPHLIITSSAVLSLLLATFCQVLLQAITYFVELRAVNPAIHFTQALSYAGAANFSLFVSLTPGAIGFRETFLVFSQQLHHVSTANILSASIIDRGCYIVFLLLLLVLTLSLHAQTRLHLKTAPKTTQE